MMPREIRPGRTGDDDAGGLNDYADSDTAEVTPTADAFIDAEKTVAIAADGGTAGQVDPGDTLEYTIVLDNTNGDVANVVFTDTVPAFTTYVGGSLSSTQGTPDDSAAPDLSVDVGDMALGDTVTVTFRVTVDAGTPEGTVIRNQGSVDSDDTVPEPTDEDGNDGNGDQPTDIPVGGEPVTSDLYVWKFVEWWTDADSSGDITPGDTMQYWVIFTNTGNTPLTNVSFTDTIPADLTYNGTAVASSGALDMSGAPAVSLTGMSIAADDFEYIRFQVTVDAAGTFENQGTADADETDPVNSDGNGDPTDGEQPTVFQAVDSGGSGDPVLDFEKRWRLTGDVNGNGRVNPGDELTYTLHLTDTGSAPAENVRVVDSVPANTTMVAGSVDTSVGIVVSEDPVTVNIGPVDPGETVTMTFRVTVDVGTADGTVIENQGTATSDNHPDEPSDDNGNDPDGKNPTLTPVEDPDSGSGQPSGLSKTLHDSSEAGSTGTDGLIGEVITWRIAVDIPAGVTPHATISDTLPAGMAYVAGSARLSHVFDTGLVASADPGGVNGAASGIFVSLADGTDVTISGQTVSVYLGDLINSDNDADTEQYVLEIDGLVENIAANQAGTTLTDEGGFSYWNGFSQERQLTPADETVTVIEPGVTVVKDADPQTLLTSGGTVTFTVTVTNPTGATVGPAYDLRIIDTLPAEYSNLSSITTTPAGGVSGITDNSAGTTLEIAVDTFPADGQLVVEYTVDAAGSLAEGTITNTADLTWTSLPGDRGTGNATPGDSGDSDGERTGSEVNANDYADDDPADVTVGTVNLDKSIDSAQSRYAIGDPVPYRIEITVPDWDEVTGAVFEDVLDSGLTYETGTLAIVYPAGFTSTNDPSDYTRQDDTPNLGEETLTLDFGTIENTTGSPETITLTYSARVDNLLANQNNTTLDNTAEFRFDNPGTGGTETLTDGESVTVGEPHLTLSKTTTSPTTDLDAGDTVDYQVVIGNNGDITAYETVVTDTLPAGLENVTGTGVTVIDNSGNLETPTLTVNAGEWETSAFDLPVGDEVTITFTVELADSVVPGQSIQNGVDATFTSRDGTDTGERDGDSPDSNQDDDTDLDNYNVSDTAPDFTVADPVQLDKEFHPDDTDTTYTIGEEATYRLTVEIVEGTVEDLVVTDTLPGGVTYLSANVGVGNGGITHGYTAPPVQAVQFLTFDFGDLVNPANGDDTDDQLTIDITVRVDNAPGNQDGTILGNNASLTFTGPTGQETREFDDDTSTPDIDPLELEVVEPELEITKTADPAAQSLGDEVAFEITVDHLADSTADAYEISVVDQLPVGLTYVGGSGSPAPTVTGDPSTGQVLTFEIAALTLADDNTTISYRATVNLDATEGVPLDNTAEMTWKGLPGATGLPAGGRNGDDGAIGINDYADSDTAQVTPTTAAFIDAVKTVADVDGGEVLSGDLLEYTVTLENTHPTDTMTNTVFTDPIPVNATYEAGTITFGGGLVTDDADADAGDFDITNADAVTVVIGDMLPGAVETITFQVRIDGGLPAGTVISNQGSVDSDDTVPEPTDEDGNDGNGDQPTDITVNAAAPGPGLRSEKTVSMTNDTVAPVGTINVGDEITYTITLTNTGDVDLNNVELTDTIPSEVTITGVSANADWTSPSQDVTASIASLAIGNSEVITVTGDVNTAGTIVNQGDIDSDETDPGQTDGNSDPTDGDQPTVFVAEDAGASGTPTLDAFKADELFVDADGNGFVTPGDTLRYAVTISNSGSAGAVNVNFEDVIPDRTSVVAGSVQTSKGSVLGDDPVRINIGNIASGEVVTVYFQVRINGSLPAGTTQIENQGVVISDNEPDVPTDDPDTPDNDDETITEVVTGSIGDYVWHDEDGDGIQDPGEGYIHGAEVFLDLNDNGVRDPDEPYDTSDLTGDYEIKNLTPGTYIVRVVESSIPPGYQLTTGNDPMTVTLSGGERYRDADFGYRSPLASLGDYVWWDTDEDGIQDAGESGVSGVTVELIDPATNTVIDTTTTDGTGFYRI